MREALTDSQIHEATHLVGLGLSYHKTIRFMRLECAVSTLWGAVNAKRLEKLEDAKAEIRAGIAGGVGVGIDLYRQVCQ